jgi:hypothetical protein
MKLALVFIQLRFAVEDRSLVYAISIEMRNDFSTNFCRELNRFSLIFLLFLQSLENNFFVHLNPVILVGNGSYYEMASG